MNSENLGLHRMVLQPYINATQVVSHKGAFVNKAWLFLLLRKQPGQDLKDVVLVTLI